MTAFIISGPEVKQAITVEEHQKKDLLSTWGLGSRERLKTELQRIHTLSEHAPLTYFFQSVPSFHYPLVAASGL